MPDPTGRISHIPEMHRGFSWKPAVRCATTASITISTGLNAGDVIDGITLAAGDRVLVKDQGTASQNGIYIAGVTPVRAADMDQDGTTTVPAEEVAGAFVYVIAGTTNAAKLFRATNVAGATIGSTSIAFTEFSSGGGSTTLPLYNVQDYGAIGDGTTDDTTAITDTRDAADATSGGIIFFPPGTYKITTRITFTGGGYWLMGSGSRYGPARVHQATANTGAFLFQPSSGTANRTKAPVITDLVISGVGGASSGKGIEAQNDIHVERCFMYGFYDGLYIGTASYYSYVAHSTFTDCDRAGVVLDSTNNTTIDTCRFTGLFSGGSAPIGAMQYGIYIGCTFPTGLNTKIVNSSIEYFSVDGIYGSGMFGCEISGNYFETQQSSSGNAHINLGPGNAAKAVFIHGNYFQGDTTGFHAIKGTTTDRITVEANYFGVNAAIGISAAGGGNANWLLINNINNPAGTFSLPSSSYTLDPAAPPMTSGDAAGGDLSGTYPNPSVVDDSHSHTAATLPAATSGGELLLSSTASVPPVFGDILTTSDETDFVYSS